MSTILLSGGATANWLPLFSPFIALAAIGWCIRLTILYIRKRKQHIREQQMLNDLTSHLGEGCQSNIAE